MDTNVFVSALHSRRGASYRLLRLVGTNSFEIALSVALVLEYEQVAKSMSEEIGLSDQEIDDIIDYLCRVGQKRVTHYLWRPCLKDAKDDMVVELAVAAQSDYIVTFNLRDFRGAEQFGIQIVTPKVLLEKIGELR